MGKRETTKGKINMERPLKPRGPSTASWQKQMERGLDVLKHQGLEAPAEYIEYEIAAEKRGSEETESDISAAARRMIAHFRVPTSKKSIRRSRLRHPSMKGSGPKQNQSRRENR